MMNNIIALLIATTIMLIAANNATARQVAVANYLTIVNNWHYPIRVQEGDVLKKEMYVYPNANINWQMLTGTINSLRISYQKEGAWQLIPACPHGNMTGGLHIAVAPANWDPTTPVCYLL